eukprot:1355238-Pleurochrysis_carterae.AAC.1
MRKATWHSATSAASRRSEALAAQRSGANHSTFRRQNQEQIRPSTLRCPDALEAAQGKVRRRSVRA